MPRLQGIPAGSAGWKTRIIYYFTRKSLSGLTGNSPEKMLEPVEILALSPSLLSGYAKLEQATAGLTRLPRRLQVLAEVRASTLTHCEYCIDISSRVALQWGLTKDELAALPSYASSDLFSELDKIVLEYATGMSSTPAVVSDELFARLKAHLSDLEILELTQHVAIENFRNRFNVAMGIGAPGFSEGGACAVPVPAGK